MKITFHARWFILMCSLVVLIVLRNDKMWLTIYVAVVVGGLLGYAWIMPRMVARAERRFTRDALQLLSQGRASEVIRLAASQRLLRRFGRKHLVPDMLGMSASADGDHENARRAFLEALRHAPPEERMRIEVNLATEEFATGRTEAAEGRFRALLDRRPDLAPALANLGRLLRRFSEAYMESASYLRRAIEVCDPRELPGLKADLAEALLRGGHPDWDEALDAARASGVDEERLEAITRLQKSPS